MSKKGLLQSLEAVIAILIVTTVFFLIFRAPISFPELETVNFRLIGINALKTLDDANELGTLALNNDTKTIESIIDPFIPSNLDFRVIVCTSICPSPIIRPAKTLTSVEYFTAGNYTNISPRKVVLYIWTN